MTTIRKDVTLAELKAEKVKAEEVILGAIRAVEWLGVKVDTVALLHQQRFGCPVDAVEQVRINITMPQ